MAKTRELKIGEYDLTLTINRKIILKALDKFPDMLKDGADENNIKPSVALDFNIYTLYLMANKNDSLFTLEKAEEIFEYAEDCVVEVDGKEQIAQDYLAQKISEFIQEGFTQDNKAKKIKVELL